MSGWWLVSYIVLWVLVLVLLVFLLAVMRELAVVRGARRIRGRPNQDSPPPSSLLPELHLPLTNGKAVSLRPGSGSRHLLVFLTPMCAGCQTAVDRVNALARSEPNLDILVLLSGPESPCSSFLTLFPIEAPVTVDGNQLAADVFNVRVTPSAALYGEDGALVGTAIISRDGDLERLVNAPGRDVGEREPLGVTPSRAVSLTRSTGERADGERKEASRVESD